MNTPHRHDSKALTPKISHFAPLILKHLRPEAHLELLKTKDLIPRHHFTPM